ncbi:TNT domain-containing protein [Aspergillus ruber CBS 135680]|uniref:TNT domain-containing protein n=1 Tax=Aspergillus ruber (strain CBS 135680) TaxID=1388766 RepID=A0A017S778_ASPRC|nr:uncharacterized protein EURHEDRAFT_533360 [Aspergillus ruber CBS 135680]EYE92000.1 hypothetical protein EURHEDRAFT_533360 [Aspergillus ruber CBS 135680]
MFARMQQPTYPDRCKDNPCAGIPSQNASYVCGDSRLGPVGLPSKFPLSTETSTYARFGNLCPKEWLDKWTSSDGNLRYPPQDGFALDNDKNRIWGNYTLTAGSKVDRFGSEYGKYLTTLGAPYIERALPPGNLDTYDGKYPYNYHVYEVLKDVNVVVGPVAAWFEQPGMGTQIYTSKAVNELLEGGFLRRLSEDEYDERNEYAEPAPRGQDA